MTDHNASTSFDAIHAAAAADPEAFWAEAAKDVSWMTPPTRVLNHDNPPFTRWFEGGTINTAYNALDRHVAEGRGDQAALIYDSPVTNTKTSYTYSELTEKVAAFAGVLVANGVGYGDRVIIYMPMIPETVIAMLGCVRIGAVHSVVFGGFAANELAKRIDDCSPKMVISASCGIEPNRIVEYKPLLDEAIEISSHKPDHCIIFQREMATATMIEGRDLDWRDAHEGVAPADCVAVDSSDPCYILYTSGTTGVPKGVVRSTASHIVALKWSMKNIYDVDPGDVYWAASDVGWVVGHSYIVYAPLFHGCTTILYEGKPVGTPDAAAFWRVISEHKVKVMFTAPTAIRAIKREDPEGKLLEQFDMSHFKTQFVAGERCDPDTLKWIEDKLKVPVIDHWWQTETGWSIAATCLGIDKTPYRIGSPGRAVPSWNIQVLDTAGHPVPAGEIGSIVVKLPMPPGSLPTLWNNDDRFVDSYMAEFPGYYKTGDAGYLDEDGFVYVMARTDDIINVAGHRLSTGGMEEVLANHPDVAECAVVGAADQLKGQVPLGFLVLKNGVTRSGEDIVAEVVQMVRQEIGPVAAFKQAVIIQRLPKTRSGKILRGTMQKIADGVDYPMPATIDDPAILEEITIALAAIGYPKS
ncbi:MAG: propionyl-CoA synthetase [Alphaproteobacteria bacterium]|nr:propionyl-CoA synthetase [Alphaproteobacteria bacterium]